MMKPRPPVTPTFATGEDAVKSTQALYTNHIRNASAASLYWPLQLILNELGFDWQARRDLPAKILRIFKIEEDEQCAAEMIWNLLGSRSHIVSEKISGRADHIVSQIGEHVRGPSVLDFGCGDGRVGMAIAKMGNTVAMYDVDDYRCAEAKALSFSRSWCDMAPRINESYDTALAITVFHHCDDPENEIAELRLDARRLIVIESVVDEQMPYTTQAVVDWIYNRGMHPGAQIPVPGQFRTAQAWRETFAQHHFRVIHEQDLGIDLSVVPEHHHLFVCE